MRFIRMSYFIFFLPKDLLSGLCMRTADHIVLVAAQQRVVVLLVVSAELCPSADATDSSASRKLDHFLHVRSDDNAAPVTRLLHAQVFVGMQKIFITAIQGGANTVVLVALGRLKNVLRVITTINNLLCLALFRYI